MHMVFQSGLLRRASLRLRYCTYMAKAAINSTGARARKVVIASKCYMFLRLLPYAIYSVNEQLQSAGTTCASRKLATRL